MISPPPITNKTTVYTFQDNTAYNAADLTGTVYNSQSYDGAVFWATPLGGYTGDIQVELSPDGGVTWLVTDYYLLNARATRANSLTLAGSTVGFVVITPEVFDIRVVMSGGSAGTLTVKARIVDGRF